MAKIMLLSMFKSAVWILAILSMIADVLPSLYFLSIVATTFIPFLPNLAHHTKTRARANMNVKTSVFVTIAAAVSITAAVSISTDDQTLFCQDKPKCDGKQSASIRQASTACEKDTTYGSIPICCAAWCLTLK
uniref:Uncharacterized protein n=1 Tax=Hyaloperonospora arabidopsidis (strain Emoy2) TaxID=559515 RepID=M4BRG6_HYAAE